MKDWWQKNGLLVKYFSMKIDIHIENLPKSRFQNSYFTPSFSNINFYWLLLKLASMVISFLSEIEKKMHVIEISIQFINEN